MRLEKESESFVSRRQMENDRDEIFGRLVCFMCLIAEKEHFW